MISGLRFFAVDPHAVGGTSGRQASTALAGEDCRKAFWIGLSLIIILLGLYRFPVDDGLRHVGLAFGEPRSWGDAYPYSIFQVHGDYDPWYGYDLTLRGLATLFGILPLPRLLQQFVVAKLLSILFMGGLLLLVVRRSNVVDQIKDHHSLVLAMLLISLLLLPPLMRFSLIRPFAFGTLFLIYATSGKGMVRGALSAGLLSFLYPYLAWLYTLPAALANFLRGNRFFAVGVLGATLATLLVQPSSFWSMLRVLFRSDAARAEFAPQITEFEPLIGHLAALGFFLVAWMILIPRFSPTERKLRTEHVLLLLFLPLSVKYVRYFVDVELCLLFVAYGRPLIRTLRSSFEGVVGFWRGALERARTRVGLLGDATAKKKSRSLKPYLAVAYAAVLVLIGSVNHTRYVELESFYQELDVIPRSSLLLTEFDLQYELLYARPDLSLVPSSELVFARPDIKREYLSFFNDGQVCPLAHKIGAQYYVEAGRMYLHPGQTGCLEGEGETAKVKIWRIVAAP